MSKHALAILLLSLASLRACKSSTAANPALLAANVADPMDLNAVSDFNSCVGHPYPDPASPNSGKNYFWPNSTNFGTNNGLKLYAACDGTTAQNSNDTNDPAEFTRRQTIHLYCDGSSTALRYFHAAAFGAWSARGVTSVSQTVNAGNPTCTTYSANIGDRGIFVFSPQR